MTKPILAELSDDSVKNSGASVKVAESSAQGAGCRPSSMGWGDVEVERNWIKTRSTATWRRTASLFSVFICGVCIAPAVPAQWTTIDVATEFANINLIGPAKTNPPMACVADRTITIWPTNEQLIVYVSFSKLPPGSAYQAIGAPFMVDQRLDALPHKITPWGDWRGTWPSLRAVIGVTPGPDLFVNLPVPIPPGDYAVQTFIVRQGFGHLSSVVAVK